MPSDVPAMLIGLIVAVYWGRVAHLARNIRRRAGHSANVIPPGIFGRLTRTIWFPIVFLWIIIPLLGPLLPSPKWLLRPVILMPIIGWLALSIATAAFVATLICWKKMGKSWRMGIDPAEVTPLVTTGPFAYVRNPIYALSSVLMLATAAAYPAPLMLAVAIMHLVLLQLEARREEKYLVRVHGEIYSEYCARVGRFFPRL